MKAFYHDLARWWPLISPVEDYQEVADIAHRYLQSAQRKVKKVLELGAGGGHSAFYLKQHYAMTLSDLSGDMLALSKRLNPECKHTQGDMRHLRLSETFDGVFVHDAVDYMCTPEDLEALFKTLFVHCRDGGVVVLMPDHTREDFEAYTDHCGNDGENHIGARCFEWCWDPDPEDTTVVTDYVFVLRDSEGQTEMFKERHTTGLFARQYWLDTLEKAGFRAEFLPVKSDEMEHMYPCFVGHKA